MARKRRASPSPSPSPPPATPPRDEPSSSEEEEEEAEATPATQKAPQNPKPPSTAAADADSSDGGGDESSDSEDDAEAFQIREFDRSPAKPSSADSKLDSVADEEDGRSSESPEPVQKAAARADKAKAGKKRQAAESAASGKAKKAKAEVEKPAPKSTLSVKAEAGADKAPSDPNLSRKGKKHKAAKDVLDHSPSGKPEKPASRQRWTTEDEIKILEALVSHIKTNGNQPSATDLIAAVGDSLERKSCSKSDMYEKVRNLKQRHEITAKKAASTGTLPHNDDDLRKFSLSEEVWGERANEVASSKSKKGQTNKEKADEHTKVVTAKEATSTKEKVDRDAKGRLSKKASTTDTPAKSKKRQNYKEESETDAAKTGTTKETTNAAAQNGGTLVRSKSGKSDKEKKDGDAESLGPKEATAVQNDGGLTLLKNGETHEENMDTDPNMKNMRKRFSELQNLYPNLTSYVESIQAQHPCGETLKRAFDFIADEKACSLESKIRKQRLAEMKMDVRRADTKKEVTNIFIGLLN